MRISVKLRMTLLSDAIFGSGFSIPGGEDIAVRRDGRGYPYLKGSTFKGLLRESVENLLVWTGGDQATLDALFGTSGWTGKTSDRRLQFTDLTLEEPPEDPENCFGSRTFTKLEEGVVQDGTLRQAACICSGLTFVGSLVCREEDLSLLRDGLRGVKYVGTSRSRGFGRVRLEAGETAPLGASRQLGPAACLELRLRTELPVLATDLGRSYGNGYETVGYLPGSALRGAVMTALSQQDPAWFEAHKQALLTEVQFLDALPDPAGLAALPAIRGFYEDKTGETFETVVKNGDFAPGLKRAKLGSCCAIDGGTLRYWSARTGGVTRISRGRDGQDSLPFQVRYLEAGQDFRSCILLQDPALASAIARALPETIWLGADRYEGFGKCAVTALEALEAPAWERAYGYGPTDPVGTRLYLLALSPFTMLDRLGEPCGLDLTALAQRLGVAKVELAYCSTALTACGGFNRTWGCREASLRMYDRGSLFQLCCDAAPKAEALLALQREGLGVRTAQGFGRILFLRTELLEAITGKAAVEPAETDDGTRALIAERPGPPTAGFRTTASGSAPAACPAARSAQSREPVRRPWPGTT